MSIEIDLAPARGPQRLALPRMRRSARGDQLLQARVRGRGADAPAGPRRQDHPRLPSDQRLDGDGQRRVPGLRHGRAGAARRIAGDDPPAGAGRRRRRRPRGRGRRHRRCWRSRTRLWGERYGSLRDPFGHNWSLGTPLRDTTPEAVATAMTAMPRRWPDREEGDDGVRPGRPRRWPGPAGALLRLGAARCGRGGAAAADRRHEVHRGRDRGAGAARGRARPGSPGSIRRSARPAPPTSSAWSRSPPRSSLLAAPLSPAAGVAGGALAALTFAVTSSLMLALPIWEPTLGFPALGPLGQFLVKDVALLGIALVVLADSLDRPPPARD